jgi:DNA-binding LacI/PurR family transcriptional regulator
VGQTSAVRATIVDVAQRAGVAISSASAALNDRPGVSPETRDRVREAARELQYVPSMRGRSLSSKRAFSIGFILERDFGVLEADPFFGAFIGGVEESLAPRNYALSLQVVTDATANLARHLDLVDSRRVDGVILSEIVDGDPRIEALSARDVPVVGVNADIGFPFPAVRQDHRQSIRELVGMLVSLGHRHIAHVSGPPSYIHSRQRLEAWRSAVAEFGLSVETVVEGDFTHEGGLIAADRLLRDGRRPTAVFCANDLMAIGLMNRAIELGLDVPGDLSVAGFDGISLGAYVRPALTTIATSPRALGREAARMLLDAIDGNPSPDLDIDATTLLVRESVSAAR